MSESLKERYIIFFFTDSGFKREKYLYNVKLADIETHRVFHDKRSFVYKEAEISKLDPPSRDEYEQSLKYYRDMKNVIDH
jgi:hypothetical protein